MSNLFHDSDYDSSDDESESKVRQETSWYKKAKQAKANAETQGHGTMLKRGMYEFGSVADQNAFKGLVEATPQNKRFFHEVAAENQPTWLCADVDAEGIDCSRERVVALFQDLVKQCLPAIGQEYDAAQQRWLRSSGEKISFHWIYKGAAFADIRHQKPFWAHVAHVIESNKDYKDFRLMSPNKKGVYRMTTPIDLQIYRLNGSLRAVDCTHADGRVLKPCRLGREKVKLIRKYDFCDYLICIPPDKVPQFADTSRIPQHDAGSAWMGTREALEAIIEEAVPNVKIHEINNRLIQLRNVGERECLISGDTHTSNNSYAVIGRTKIVYGCHGEGCEGTKVIHRFAVEDGEVDNTVYEEFEALAMDMDLSEHSTGKILAKMLGAGTESQRLFIDEEGDGHLWNDKTRLWEFGKAKWLAHQTVPLLRPTVKQCIAHVKAEYEAADDGAAKFLLLVYKELQRFQRQVVGSMRGIAAIFKCASADLRDSEFVETLDLNKHFVPTSDGCVVDLRTGVTRPRVKEDLFSFFSPVKMLAQTDQSGDVLKFMASLFRDVEVREYMRVRLGAMLSGEAMREIDIWYGCGRNGKSVLVKLMSKIMGKFSCTANRHIFIDKEKFSSASGHTSHLVPLIGKRMISCCEISKHDSLNSTMLKGLSGGDEIAYRGAYAREEKTFTSAASCILAVNDKPRFDAEDQAIIDRLRYIPFNSRFVEQNAAEGEQIADPQFIENLLESGLDGVFSYLVQGAKEFYAMGCILDAPASVLEAKRLNIASADLLGLFLEEHYDTHRGRHQRIHH